MSTRFIQVTVFVCMCPIPIVIYIIFVRSAQTEKIQEDIMKNMVFSKCEEHWSYVS